MYLLRGQWAPYIKTATDAPQKDVSMTLDNKLERARTTAIAMGGGRWCSGWQGTEYQQLDNNGEKEEEKEEEEEEEEKGSLVAFFGLR